MTKRQQSSARNKDQCLIKLDTIDDFYKQYIHRIQNNHLEIRVWDITSDLDVPSYHFTLIDDYNLSGLSSFTGTGAHLSKSIALFRAITEAHSSTVSLYNWCKG